MRRTGFLAVALALTLSLPAAAGRADDGSAPQAGAGGGAPADLAARAFAVADTVLGRHPDPPTRQQMILAGIRGVLRAAGETPQPGLALRVSDARDPAQLGALLTEVWPKPRAAKADDRRAPDLADAFFEGMLGAVPGHAWLMSAKDADASEQFAANLYVGIHIALGWSKVRDRPEIKEAFEGGPADRAGIKEGDLIEEVDGEPTKGQTLRQVVEKLRGPEGSKVTLRVRTPAHPRDGGKPSADDSVRTVTLARGKLPHPTVVGFSKRKSGGWDVKPEPDAPVGYLKLDAIRGSTPQEFRAMARQLEAEGARALVLDLRRVSQASVHATVLLADDLLGGGTIGRYRRADRVETFEADPDALLAGWPLAVLIDRETDGGAAWLAAALRDNGRAVLVGSANRKPGLVRAAVPVGDGTSVEMITGFLERGDGRPIGRTGDLSEAHPLSRVEPPAADAPKPEPDGPAVVPDVDVSAPRDPGAFRDPCLSAALEALRAKLKPS